LTQNWSNVSEEYPKSGALQIEMKHYPKENLSTVEEEIQVVPIPIILQSPPEAKSENFAEKADLTPQAKVESWLEDVENEIPVGSAHFSDQELLNFMAELTKDIEVSFNAIHQIEDEVQVLILKNCESLQECENAKATGKFPCSQKDIKEVAKSINKKILEIESQKKAQEKTEKLFLPQESENLHGELEKDLEKFRTNPKLFELLCKYKEIFGPLPPPSAGCPLVLMDIELKEEWEGKPLRQRCWPMPINEQQEINLQAEELIKAGLAEVFPPGETPHVCSPTFLVDKKDSKTKRMVIQYRKLNSRTKPHAGYLPNMDELVERLAKCKFKSKLDIRGGFWQVGLTERAKNLSTFCIPSGRCLRPLCMMFGLQGAPGIFHERMEILISQCKQDPQVRKILKSGHLASFA